MSQKYKQELPEEIKKKLDAYIDRIKAIKWFQPAKDLKKSDVETQLSIVLDVSGVKASVEYRKLNITNDRDSGWLGFFDFDLLRDLGLLCLLLRVTARDAAW